jgi:hypothetical protein
MGKAPDSLRGQLGIAVAKRTYAGYRKLLESARWQRALNQGARAQRLRRNIDFEICDRSWRYGVGEAVIGARRTNFGGWARRRQRLSY